MVPITVRGEVLGCSGEGGLRPLSLQIGGYHRPLLLLRGEVINPLPLPGGVSVITVKVPLSLLGRDSYSPLPLALLGWEVTMSVMLLPFV